MTSLDELRSTLTAHAGAASDPDPAARVASVHGRVAAVRRRRRMLAAGGVAAVLVIAAAISVPVLSDHGTKKVDPASKLPADVRDGHTVTANGFEWKVIDQEAISGATPAVVQGPQSDAVAYALVAGSLGQGELDLVDATGPSEVDVAVADGSVGRLHPSMSFMGTAPEGGTPSISILAKWAPPSTMSLPGGAGQKVRGWLVTYGRTGNLPEGDVSPAGTAVFRDVVAGYPRMDSVWSQPGDPQVALRTDADLAHVQVVTTCNSTRPVYDGSGVAAVTPVGEVYVDGQDQGALYCYGPSADATAQGASQGGGPGPHTIEIRLMPRYAKTPGIEVGVALYDHADALQIHGMDVDRLVEFQGETWKLTDQLHSGSGAATMKVDLPADEEPLLLGYVLTTGIKMFQINDTAGFVSDGVQNDAGVASSALVGVLPAHTTPDTLRGALTSPGPEAQATILIYRLDR